MEIKVVEVRNMTEAEVETVASLLFQWWRREFESKKNEEDSNKHE